MTALRNRDLISNCDSFPDAETDPDQYADYLNNKVHLVVWSDDDDDDTTTYPIGYMPRAVFDELVRIPKPTLADMGLDADVNLMAAGASPTVIPLHRLLRHQRTVAARTQVLGALNAYWRAHETFGVLRTWRDELWPVYGRGGDAPVLLFSVERAATGLLGVVRYGVHMTAYELDDDASPETMRIWVPRRAADKSTYPGMLDNTVAGGLMTDERPFACLVREADEEASLPADVLARHTTAAGLVTYVHVTEARSGAAGDAHLQYVHPECEWVFDLRLPASGSVVPRPQDGEVESFRLCPMAEVRTELARGAFKPNCAAVLLDFLARHGLEHDAGDLAAIARQLHRRLPFPGPHDAAGAAAAVEEVRQWRQELEAREQKQAQS